MDGGSRFAVARVNSDGTLDQSFGATGTTSFKIDILESSSQGTRVVVQPNGKIVVFGYVDLPDSVTRFAVARLNTDGSLDNTFGGQTGTVSVEINGSNNAHCNSGAVQADGKIVLAGTVDVGSSKFFGAVRLNSDGTLDTSFNSNGTQPGIALTAIDNSVVDNDCVTMTLDKDEKIILAGYTFDGNDLKKFAVARFNTDGTIDENFNSSGLQKGTASTVIDNNMENNCYSVLVQEDGKILLSGNTTDIVNNVMNIAVARFNSDGTIDENYNLSGIKKGTVSVAMGNQALGTYAILQRNGKLIVTGTISGGTDYKLLLVRFKVDGTLDTTFNPDGVGSLPGTIVVAVTPIPMDISYASVIQPDGKIVLAGYTVGDQKPKFLVARFLGDDTPVDPVNPIIPTKDPFSTRLIEKYGLIFASA